MMILAPFLLVMADPSAPPTFNRCQPRFELATAQLKVADRLIKRHALRSANDRLDSAIATLGGGYANNSTADDTGMKLIVADSFMREGKWKMAVGMKRSMLAARLRLCTIPDWQ